ncbi:helix-turn-helix domain-containing protein [Streptomyces sp. NPDC046716]|uniref:helix-turn-helix domain-containing protein n=1 Tax=Streptomyces sp. NPDC046716 TaxID=3157093 RepID=UPI0033E5100A
MDTQNPSAPSRAPGRIPVDVPRAGIVHENVRHQSHFTVVGNHLAQHRELSGLAIGLGVHIQSLPAGARVDVRTLAARFPEGTTRIAAALRELEAHGYLRRERHRTPDGRVRTRTVSCNRPGATPDQERPKRQQQKPRAKPLTVPHPEHRPSPATLQAATDLLAGLHRADARLALSARDTERLAPGVIAWLERDLTPTAVRHALTRDLPEDRPVRSPAALLAHRLTALLPPMPPAFRAPAPPDSVRHPLQNCETCDRAYRGPQPGSCPGCRTALGAPAFVPCAT